MLPALIEPLSEEDKQAMIHGTNTKNIIRAGQSSVLSAGRWGLAVPDV